MDKPNADARGVADRFQNIRYLDKYALFCDDQTQSMLLYDADGQMLFADNLHLTKAGGLHFGRRMASLAWFGGESGLPSREQP
jgi:hypothetical protein